MIIPKAYGRVHWKTKKSSAGLSWFGTHGKPYLPVLNGVFMATNISVFGIATMQVYKDTIRSTPAIAGDHSYLVAVNDAGDVSRRWIDDCSNHEEALSRCLGSLYAENRGAEYAVIGPCRTDDACGGVRGKTYLVQ
jgi:hypothetical protein